MESNQTNTTAITSTEAAAVAEAVAQRDPNTVALDTPIKRGNGLITEVTLRKPSAGELRGVSLAELLQNEGGRTANRAAPHHQPHPAQAGHGHAGPRRPGEHGHGGGGFFADEGNEAGLCDRVEDAVADLALVFHWTPADVADMTVTELMEWRERARQRYERQE